MTEQLPQNSSIEALPRTLVLRAGVILELIVGLIALLWSLVRGFSYEWRITSEGLATGFALLAILSASNAFLIYTTRGTRPWQQEFREFLSQVVLRLVANLNARAAIILALLSGIAEELLFRGALWAELSYWGGSGLALIGSSVLFACAHFGSTLRRFPRVFCVYLVFGFFFGALYYETNSLTLVMLVHSLYNFCAFAILTNGFMGTKSL